MTPQIIRTREELAALDPDTILSDSAGPYTASYAVAAIYDEDYEARDYLPAVVLATGDTVRAARQALGEADREPATDDFHSSIGLWQPRPPATWEKE